MRRIGSLLSPLLVGRDDVLELAGRRLTEAADAHGELLLLAGDAGIGKTRLLAAIRSLAEARQFRVAGGSLAPQDSEVPAGILLDLGREMSRLPAFGGLGSELLDLVDGIIGAERPQRRLLVQRTADLLSAAGARPTMLVFEDLQWADEVSLEIVGDLARRARDSRMLVAAAYRTEDAAAGSLIREWRSRLVAQRLAEEIRLPPLGFRETGLLAALILGTGLPVPQRVMRVVFERTDGVPLHVEELLGALGPEGLSDTRSIREAVPETLEDATLQRLRRLSPDAQAVARAGAVLGRSFVPDVLARVMDVPVETIDGPIQELGDNRILDGPGGRDLYDFRHQLLRDAIYQSVPATERRRLHARAAEYGASLEGASEIHASLHYERAGMRSEAYRTALAGARRAARMSSHREATELYGRAYANVPEATSPAERAALVYSYADEAAVVDAVELATQLNREARDLYLAADDPIGAAKALLNLGSIQRWDGEPLSERLDLIEQAVRELEAQPRSRAREEGRIVAYGLLGWAHIDGIDLDRARTATRTAMEIAVAEGLSDEVGGIGSLTACLDPESSLGMVEVLDGGVDSGLAAIRAVAERALRGGFESAGVTAARDASIMALRSMEYAQAAIRLQDARRYADRIQHGHCGGVMAATDALLAWVAGDWQEAQRIGDQTVADTRGRAPAVARWALGYVAFGRGKLDAARRHLESALEYGVRAEWYDMTLPARWGIAETDLLAGKPDGAVRECEAAYSAARALGDRDQVVPFVVTGVRAHLAQARPEAAEEWLLRAVEWIGPTAIAGPAFEHARGLLRLAAGSTGAARESLEAAVAGWDARGRTWERLWARLDLATALVRSNRYVDAARLVQEVRTEARRLESEPLLARAAALDRLLRGRGNDAAAWHPLTVREFEVARHVAAGLTNAEIGATLSLSPRTIGAHIEHILAKLGVSRRSEIAAWVPTIAPGPQPAAMVADR